MRRQSYNRDNNNNSNNQYSNNADYHYHDDRRRNSRHGRGGYGGDSYENNFSKSDRRSSSHSSSEREHRHVGRYPNYPNGSDSRKRRYEGNDRDSPNSKMLRMDNGYDYQQQPQQHQQQYQQYANRQPLPPPPSSIVDQSPTNSNAAAANDAEEKKKARLEAWKKKMAEKNLLEKLKEEKERKQKEEAAQHSATVTPAPQIQQQNAIPPSIKTASMRLALQKPKKISTDTTATSFNAFEDEDETPADTSSNIWSASDEVDPLDAFMSDIQDTVKKLPNFHEEEDVERPRKEDEEVQYNTITLDEIINQKSEVPQEESTVGEDSEDFHQQFLEAIRKKEEEEKKKQQEEMEKWKKLDEAQDSSNQTREVFFSDEGDDTTADDYFTTSLFDTSLQAVPSVAKNKKDLKPVDHSKMKYLPFRKDFFIVPKELRDLSAEQVHDLRNSMSNIRVRGKNVPPPVKSWVQCGLDDATLKIIETLGFTRPFPIQAQAVPCIMSGRNVIGIAKTGSGKTLAFLLPMIRHIQDQPPLKEGDGPVGLIIAPTRELACQIFDELTKFSKPLGIQAVCAYGGASIAEQIAALKRGAHVIVCTPGRMIDLLCANRGRVTNLARVTYVVLDEADRMFDMGFGPQITRIVDNIRPDRQIVLFSATFPKPLEALAQKTLKQSVEIIVGGRSVACDTVRQFIEIRDESTKFLRLLELLGEYRDQGSILIFTHKQTEVGNLFKDLLSAGYDVLCIHGGMEQLDRDHAIHSFKTKEKSIMIATSVAARGLHVEDLNLVINYTVSNHVEDYVHRVGRTGRAGKTGTAYTFITPDEERYAPGLVKALQQSGNSVPPELERMSQQFLEKKKTGTVGTEFPKQLSGYVGSGYKFDLAEQNKKKEEMKRQMKTLGVEDTTEELLMSDEEDEIEDEDAVDDTIRRVSKGAVSESKISSSLTPLQRAQALAAQINIAMSLKAANIGPNTNTGFTVSGTGVETFETEIEINDYPQQARWGVTHKDALEEIHDYTGATVTTKGMHVEAGKQPPQGERKLYLQVEGPTHESVRRAKLFIKKKLEDACAQQSADSRHAGRYSIF